MLACFTAMRGVALFHGRRASQIQREGYGMQGQFGQRRGYGKNKSQRPAFVRCVLLIPLGVYQILYESSFKV
jgi:hypothetical protein